MNKIQHVPPKSHSNPSRTPTKTQLNPIETLQQIPTVDLLTIQQKKKTPKNHCGYYLKKIPGFSPKPQLLRVGIGRIQLLLRILQVTIRRAQLLGLAASGILPLPGAFPLGMTNRVLLKVTMNV